MEANINGFNVAAHLCVNGSCDEESLCKVLVNEADAWNYGSGTEYTINTENSFNVKTQFFATEETDDDLPQLIRIDTTLTQGANEVLISLDCTDYLGPFTTLLEGKMAVAFSSYSVGEDNYIDDTCGVSNSNST